jgi:signal transduction histidine kinase
MESLVRILILEDMLEDSLLMRRELEKSGFQFDCLRVENQEDFERALEQFNPDLILSDYSLPRFNGMAALEIAQNKLPDTPFLFVSGIIGEEFAIEALKKGATDYVLKDRLGRLGTSVKRALRESEDRQQRKRALEDLQDSEQRYRTLFEEVRRSRVELENLSRQLLEAQESERRRIARELHDEIGQALTAVKINLQGINESTGSEPCGSQVQESIGIVDRVLAQVRNISLDLRPSLLDDLGLVSALRWYLDRQSMRGGFTFELKAASLTGRLGSELETVCFRVTQEAITNILKHARAKHVQVELKQKNQSLTLIIRDDGIGFNVAEAHTKATGGTSLGLLSMQERVFLSGGHLTVESGNGKTEIVATFPSSLASQRENEV